jgi:anti-sigma regulatory factor (Ser/Thr protein kinase)
LDLPPTTDSVSRARRHVREQVQDADLDSDTAELLVSEVVTNAVLHARTAVMVRVEVRLDGVRVEVSDGSPREPRVSPYSSDAATGRGLRLLERLARSWGVRSDRRGKTVWFEVGPSSHEGGLRGLARGADR